MKKIKSITVTYEDDTEESFSGDGQLHVNDTVLKGNTRRDPDRDVRWISATLQLDTSPLLAT